MLPGFPYVSHMTRCESLNKNEKEKPVFVFSFRRKFFFAFMHNQSQMRGVVSFI